MTRTTRPPRRALPAVALAALLAAVLAVSGCSAFGNDEPVEFDRTDDGRSFQTVVDELGREVRVPDPVQSVAIGYNHYNIELVRGVGAGDRIVGVAGDGVDDTPGNEEYWSSVPGADTIVGRAAEFNYDAVVAADPELFITLSNSPYEEAVEKLEPFGIPVLVVTAWEPALFEQNVELLGEVFGTEERAADFSGLYTEINDLLSERLEGVEPRSVYFENGEPNVTGVPGSGWHDIIELAGGENIFADIDFSSGNFEGTVHQTPVDPADVLARDPDLVIRNGLDGTAAGYEPWPAADVAALADELAARPGWSDLTAVRNGDVYVANNFWTSALAKGIGALGLAKRLHPDLFADVDTEEYFRQWVEDFQETPYLPEEDYVHRLGGGETA
ncbi:ABC transporter substrate-binding protein [Nocardioides zeae]|uniref:ABC transporter substrate-binding protein n=1 Tax=Nocardioides imazamoxiresistens TaxID=3231893 RepID=A0ABU3Q0V9_9ACTN|nr:ABC transporter substrate-binding protein [Nocardioides zeae]MDT9595019.1 ABC transporter substrate-binding protein [Nocardioides zeae]